MGRSSASGRHRALASKACCRTRYGPPDWNASTAFRYRTRGGTGGPLEPVRHVAAIRLGVLKEVDAQKEKIVRNTEQFVAGQAANNVLLTGARGTGKSSLIKACLNDIAARGLRLIEVDKADMIDLPDIVDLVAERPEQFVVFCDDLSFEEGEPGYKALKSILDGSVARRRQRADLRDQQPAPPAARVHEGEPQLHAHRGRRGPSRRGDRGEDFAVERFGLWVSFYPFSQDEYLAIVAAVAARLRRRRRGDRRGAAGGAGLGAGARLALAAASPTSSRATTRAHTRERCRRRRRPRGDGRRRSRRRRPDRRRRRASSHLAARPARSTRASGNSRAASSSPARRSRQALRARAARGDRHRRRRTSQPWHVERVDYPHARVRLHFCKVLAWRGELHMREGQAMAWQTLPVQVAPVLPGHCRCCDWFAAERASPARHASPWRAPLH